jgi:hypothetical protein
MDARHLMSGSRGTWGLLSAAIVALVLIVRLEATPAAAASPCKVTNRESGRTYSSLQQAVKAVRPGADLVVTGTCHGGTFIDKDLLVQGVELRHSGRATLAGAGGRVLVIGPGVSVTLRSIVIRDGQAHRGRPGGGIVNRGRLTLRDVLVRNNDSFAGNAGGIHNEGRIRMRGRTEVRENGGLPSVLNAGSLVLEDASRIRRNSEVHNSGRLVMTDSSSIDGNSPFGRSGPALLNTGSVTMNGTSSILHQQGGGIDNSGVVTLNDRSSIHDSVETFFGATGMGGGVQNSGTLRMTGESSIRDNQVGAIPGYAGRGGGVFNVGILIMDGSSTISGNGPFLEAMVRGGGIYNASGGTLVGVSCGPSGNVVGNTPDDCLFE